MPYTGWRRANAPARQGGIEMNIYYEKDIKPEWIRQKKVAVIGYGSQGFAHSNNLRDSGVQVTVGLRAGSPSAKKASEAGLKVLETPKAVAWADVVMVLIPDHLQGEVYTKDIAPELKAGRRSSSPTGSTSTSARSSRRQGWTWR